MAEEPDDWALRILLEIREMLESCRKVAIDNSGEMKALRQDMRDRRESLSASCGFAYRANHWRDSVEQRLDDLTKRVVRLEAMNSKDASLRAEGEATQESRAVSGLLRSARNDASKATDVARMNDELWAKLEALSPEGLRKNMEYAERTLKRLAKCKKAKEI